MLQFVLSAGDSAFVQAGNPCEVGDSSVAVLLGEEADEEPSCAFIGSSDETVDPAVLSGKSALRMLLAGWAGAYMDDTVGMLLCHVTIPPWGSP